MALVDAPRPGHIRLDDRYRLESGRALMTGVHALVRVALDVRRLDQRLGRNTAVFISGYEGSPLGGFDLELIRAREHLDQAGAIFKPGLNEELAATAVAGTQLIGELDGRRYDGVVGFWYGKNPGLDRAADAIRHANISGTAPLGGAVALIGDDPSCKSSTIPSACEAMCRSLLVPLLAPGSVGDIVEFGVHAVRLSRYAGLWTGIKLVADIADASATVDVGRALDMGDEPPVRDRFSPPVLLAPQSLDAEHDLMDARLARAHEYGRMAALNRVTHEPPRPRLAILAPGLSYQSTLRALADLGLESHGLDALGIRLVSIGMPWPLDPESVRGFAVGAETVLVVEDKLPFLETQVKEALYGQQHAPQVLGRFDQRGLPLLSTGATVSSDQIALALGDVVGHDELPERARARVELIKAVNEAQPSATVPLRTPYFCSGCPHNVSTRAEPDELVGVGIGCHTLVAIDDGNRRGQLVGMAQMGGEGAQWIGLAPFTDDVHFIQNMGDGTFHHSGSLAIRAAVAAGLNITYRLLYNHTVAMTGGQVPVGKIDVPRLTEWLALEGVKRVAITTPEPERYDGVGLSPIAKAHHRDDLQRVQRDLSAVDGVTVLIHDDRCATEKRRLRKRNRLDTPAERVWINERVCEGCGDCGAKSTCLSVVPVETEFGQKTQIHQSSCNQDLTCLKGDCPSFLVVTPRDGHPEPEVPEPPADLPDPEAAAGTSVLVRMPGVGGTGVVTVSHILQMAAHMDGRHAAGLDQTGLAQKGGPVVSDVRFGNEPVTGHLRASARTADVILGFDLLGAATADMLASADPGRTRAVVNSGLVPTARMVTVPGQRGFPAAAALERVQQACEEVQEFDTLALSQRLFGDHIPANMMLVGAAFQLGWLPLSSQAIEQAIELNGTAVGLNVVAFRWGRALVDRPGAVQQAVAGAGDPPPVRPSIRDKARRAELDPKFASMVEVRMHELASFQNESLAERYLRDVERVAEAEAQRLAGERAGIAEAYARGLFKLMAYKDEYEVARLHLDSLERARLTEAFGQGARVSVLLHPPALRALGLKRKIRLRRSASPLFRLLRAARRLRGTPFDPFGRAEVRRVERALVGEYRQLVDRALQHLNDASAARVRQIAELPDLVRGYEQVKLRNVAEFRRHADSLLRDLASGRGAAPGELPVLRAG